MSGAFLLHLLRHGAPELTGRMLGRTDSPVTAEGLAACVARVKSLYFKQIVCSDLMRSQAIADAIGRERGLAPTTDARWRELDFGAWDGLAAAEIDAAALQRFWDDPDAAPPPGGERWSNLVARITDAIEELTPETSLIVTHGGAIRAALKSLCGFGLRELWAFDLPYAALISLRIWPDRTAQIVALQTDPAS
ncbi:MULTISPECIES: histidine phosphatase family protein [unclassified Sphingomonas]|uniref:histidine phosphatase family protein n=1 Tax=unclassified Sphingomonas TaxID=196159 RepID=UPI0004DED5E8|nr:MULTISPECIES: histidine phosphatase family protein [unclassified Sphingomonas]MDY1006792.1 histidine phosphatase family protein [Sphingomonas sp. CFBP9019]